MRMDKSVNEIDIGLISPKALIQNYNAATEKGETLKNYKMRA